VSAAADPAADPANGGRRGFVFRHPWIFFAALGVIALTTMRVACGSGRELGDLPVLGVVPDFTLTDQHDRAFGSRDLAGKPWIASFFFTSCRTECPAIIDANRRVAHALAKQGARPDEVLMVSFSVDPEYDTPAVLKAYAIDNGVSDPRWHLVTGPRPTLEAVIVGRSDKSPAGVTQYGFATAWGERQQKTGFFDIAHSMKLVLVDPQGGIRHYFSATEAKDLELIATHAIALARAARPAEATK